MHFTNRRVYIIRVERAATGAKCGSVREDGGDEPAAAETAISVASWFSELINLRCWQRPD